MSTEATRTEAVQAAVESDALALQIQSILITGKAQKWQGLNPVEELERLVLEFFGWSTGGKTLTLSSLESWQINAVIETMARYQERYRTFFNNYFGRDINAGQLADDAAELSDAPLKSFAGFFWDRLPEEAAKLTGDLKSARALVIGTAVLLVALTAYNATKK